MSVRKVLKRKNQRERIIKNKPLRETSREQKLRLSRPTGPLKSYSMAEFIEAAEQLEAAE